MKKQREKESKEERYEDVGGKISYFFRVFVYVL